MKKMIAEMDRTVEPGSHWFLLPKSWLSKWEQHCFFDLIMAELGTVKVDNSIARDEPGKIDYTDLMEDDSAFKADCLKEISAKFSWHNNQLKESVGEGQDFILVNTQIIEYLNSKYGVANGNYKDFMRQGRE